jgi:hypothetical protein
MSALQFIVCDMAVVKATHGNLNKIRGIIVSDGIGGCSISCTSSNGRDVIALHDKSYTCIAPRQNGISDSVIQAASTARFRCACRLTQRNDGLSSWLLSIGIKGAKYGPFMIKIRRKACVPNLRWPISGPTDDNTSGN